MRNVKFLFEGQAGGELTQPIPLANFTHNKMRKEKRGDLVLRSLVVHIVRTATFCDGLPPAIEPGPVHEDLKEIAIKKLVQAVRCLSANKYIWETHILQDKISDLTQHLINIAVASMPCPEFLQHKQPDMVQYVIGEEKKCILSIDRNDGSDYFRVSAGFKRVCVALFSCPFKKVFDNIVFYQSKGDFPWVILEAAIEGLKQDMSRFSLLIQASIFSYDHIRLTELVILYGSYEHVDCLMEKDLFELSASRQRMHRLIARVIELGRNVSIFSSKSLVALLNTNSPGFGYFFNFYVDGFPEVMSKVLESKHLNICLEQNHRTLFYFIYNLKPELILGISSLGDANAVLMCLQLLESSLQSGQREAPSPMRGNENRFESEKHLINIIQQYLNDQSIAGVDLKSVLCGLGNVSHCEYLHSIIPADSRWGGSAVLDNLARNKNHGVEIFHWIEGQSLWVVPLSEMTRVVLSPLLQVAEPRDSTENREVFFVAEEDSPLRAALRRGHIELFWRIVIAAPELLESKSYDFVQKEKSTAGQSDKKIEGCSFFSILSVADIDIIHESLRRLFDDIRFQTLLLEKKELYRDVFAHRGCAENYSVCFYEKGDDESYAADGKKKEADAELDSGPWLLIDYVIKSALENPPPSLNAKGCDKSPPANVKRNKLAEVHSQLGEKELEKKLAQLELHFVKLTQEKSGWSDKYRLLLVDYVNEKNHNHALQQVIEGLTPAGLQSNPVNRNKGATKKQKKKLKGPSEAPPPLVKESGTQTERGENRFEQTSADMQAKFQEMAKELQQSKAENLQLEERQRHLEERSCKLNHDLKELGGCKQELTHTIKQDSEERHKLQGRLDDLAAKCDALKSTNDDLKAAATEEKCRIGATEQNENYVMFLNQKIADLQQKLFNANQHLAANASVLWQAGQHMLTVSSDMRGVAAANQQGVAPPHFSPSVSQGGLWMHQQHEPNSLRKKNHYHKKNNRSVGPSSEQSADSSSVSKQGSSVASSNKT